MTFIEWKEATLKNPADITKQDGAEPEDEADVLRKMLHISDWDPRPTLLYFHKAHEEKDQGKAWAKQCKGLNDEEVARWAGLYVFVEVDMEKSDAAMLTRFGAAEDGPSFSIVARDLSVSATSGPLPDGKKFSAFLESTVQTRFPDYWKTVEARVEEQKQAFEEAKSLEKKKDLNAALDKLREVTRSNLRVAPFFNDALKLEAKISAKLLDD